LPELLELIHRQSGRRILFERTDRADATRVEFVGRIAIPRHRLFEWLQGVLSYHGYLLVPAAREDGEPTLWCCIEAYR
jgi:hypothetical protein